MPRRNRVLPTQEIAALPGRGLFMGNRGILHDDAGAIRAGWRHPHWICCLTAFKGRRRPIMAPHAYTELFFLDEAVALAAGHRPCAECRRADWLAFRAAWDQANGPVGGAADLDRQLHRARLDGRAQRRWTALAQDLPEGTMILSGDSPALITRGAQHAFAMAGYGPAQALPRGPVTVLTPAPTVAALAAGYCPVLHPTALDP